MPVFLAHVMPPDNTLFLNIIRGLVCEAVVTHGYEIIDIEYYILSKTVVNASLAGNNTLLISHT